MKTLHKSFFFLLLCSVPVLTAKEQLADPLHAAALKGDVSSQLQLADEFFFGKNRRRINPSLAAYWYRKAALQGSAQARYNLGACCEFGWGTRRSLIAAFDWYARAAAQNLEKAVLRHAQLLYSGIPDEDDGKNKLPGITPEPAKALANLRKLKNSPDARQLLAELLMRDRKEIVRNGREIRTLLEKNLRAPQVRTGTYLLLATVLEYGIGGPPDQKRAADLLEKAALLKDPEGMVRYGVILENAFGRKSDIPRALSLYRQAAKSGSARGMFELANHLKYGLHLPQDLTEAARLYQQAAEKGYPPAFALWGDCLKEGYGTARSAEKAFDCYMRGARLGDPASQVRAGRCYQEGAGVPADPAGAVYWYQKASAAGLPEGMRRFALALLSGYGIKKDIPAGTELLRRAAALGDRESEEILLKGSQ